MTRSSSASRGSRGDGGRGAFKYGKYTDNHVIGRGRRAALKKFVKQDYHRLRHKFANAHSSNSEDALTWSCFDALRQVAPRHRKSAICDLWELAFGNRDVPDGVENGVIEIGKSYGTSSSHTAGEREECTEVDVSIEGPGTLVFLEAKLYSSMSQAEGAKRPHDQIARKIRVGVREAMLRSEQTGSRVDFYFILLDIAPPSALRGMHPGASLVEASAKASGFSGKWTTAYWFERYRVGGRGSLMPLKKILADAPVIDGVNVAQLAKRMGWLTWADVFKAVLRAAIQDRAV